jgi:hypothetical protein
VFLKGGGGLEICGNGAGPIVPVDLLGGVRDGDGAYHFTSAIFVRHDETHRHPVLKDRQKEALADDDGSRGGVKKVVLERA